MKKSFEDILNRRIDTAIEEMKDGDRFTREKAQKKYQVLADIRSSIAREKFNKRHNIKGL
jgi:hypothetical protein